MIEYLKQLIVSIQQAQATQIASGVTVTHKIDVPDLGQALTGLAEELDRLDPRDFLPIARHDFVLLRTQLRFWANASSRGDGSKPVEVVTRISTLLDQYAGAGTHVQDRDFSFLNNTDLRDIIQRDYKELETKLFPDGSWKSVVVMSGSILEAILYDILTRDATTIGKVMASPVAPHTKTGGPVRDITKDSSRHRYTLENLIDVAVDIGELPPDGKETIHKVIRDYRNFIHPKAEIRASSPCGEAQAMLSLGALNAIVDHIAP